MKKQLIIIQLLLLVYLPLIADVRTVRVQLIEAATEECFDMPERPVLVMDNAVGSIGEEGDKNGHLVEISWDEMSQNFKQYTYSIEHLNGDGSSSTLMSSEYVTGFTTADVGDYTPSFNVQREYTHYRFVWPNRDMRIRASGIYRIHVYEDGDRNKEALRVEVPVTEERCIIHGRVLSNTDIEFSGRYQQLELSITDDGTSANMRQDYKIEVRQNGRRDNCVYGVPPTYVEPSRLRWEHCKELIFEAGNEYRHFDTYSTYFAGTGVDRIVYEMGDYHAALPMAFVRAGEPYLSEYDVNGQFKVNAEKTNDPDTEGEYMWVHWLLHVDQPWLDGAVYVGGDLFQNRFTIANRMDYDPDTKCYFLSAFIKQGAYDYQFFFKKKEDRAATPLQKDLVTLKRTEGSHWQTRNEYMVFVWYRPFGARADRLVGIKTL